jgi:hypothetical protein
MHVKRAHTLSMNANNSFQIGDKVSYSVGSDRYAGEVVGVSKSGHEVLVQEKIGCNPVTFTRRGNGQYRRCGWKTTGLLSHGGETKLDPTF